MPYLPIAQYGVIGDLHSAALIGSNGSIDWLCYPHFDSPSVFGALLDDDKGGRFQIHPVNDGVQTKQLYLPDTNILITRFLKADGIAEVTDFMPIENDISQCSVSPPLIMRVRNTPRNSKKAASRSTQKTSRLV